MLAHVGTYSGVFSSFANAARAFEAWAAGLNAQGGIDGHPLKAIVADDGGDPAKHRAIVQQLVERDGVIAFVDGVNPTTGQAAVEYLTKKGIPVVGGSPSSNWYYDSPTYFPQASLGRKGITKSILGATAEVASAQGKSKLALLGCSEAQICRDFISDMPALAPQFGLKVVSQALASLAQPDFTAECLAARNAGAEIMFLAFDAQSYARIARSCDAVSFKPLYSLVPNAMNSVAQVQAMQGALITSIVRPWFDTSHPSIAELHRVMKLYRPSAEADASAGIVWVSAQLLQRAATGHLSATPNPQDILNGLWSIKNDSLGGLTYPLTFNQGQTAEVKHCWWLAVIDGGKFKSPRNDVKCL